MFLHKGEIVIMVIVLSLLCALPQPAQAQRTTCGGGMVSLEGFYPLGAGLSYGQYLPSSYWEAGVNALWRSHDINDESKMQYMPLSVYGEWLYRVVGTRSRSLNLYAGAGVFLGWEFYDPFTSLPDHLSSNLPAGTFLYGIRAQAQLQIFLSRSFSILLSGKAPINFSSPCTWIQPCVCFGLRLDL